MDIQQSTVSSSDLSLDFSSAEQRFKFWHSSSHIMAEAILKHFPDALLAIGPATDEGFFYDVDLGDKSSFLTEKIPEIEATFLEICKKGVFFEKGILSREELIEMYQNNHYKLDLIQRVSEDQELSIYRSGDFIDLCKGPHMEGSSKSIQSFKILNVSGVHWRSNPEQKQLTRIQAISFPSRDELKQFLKERNDRKKMIIASSVKKCNCSNFPKQ